MYKTFYEVYTEDYKNCLIKNNLCVYTGRILTEESV